jgi:hypothetical protein
MDADNSFRGDKTGQVMKLTTHSIQGQEFT